MKILLPVDGSELSLKAVRLAIDLLGQGLSGSVVLANVQEPATFYEMVVAPDADVLQRVSTAAGVDTLEAAESLLMAAGVVYEREIASGDPAHTIVDIGERFACDPPCVLPPRPAAAGDHSPSWNMWSVLLPLARMTLTRREFRDAMEARGIGTGVSYEALHLCTLGRSYGYQHGDLPVTERIARETVTLPLHPAMTVADVDRVCSAVAEIIVPARQ